MQLKAVLTAVNDNIMYWRFIPLFIKVWKLFFPDVLIVIVFIGEELPVELLAYSKHIRLFKPLFPHISTAYTAQIIRLVYPALLKVDGAVLITDMDMLPMNQSYYTKGLEDQPDNSFILYHQEDIEVPPYKEYFICYVAARPEVWAEVFNITDEISIHNFLLMNYNNQYEDRHNGVGWGTDQQVLYRVANNLPSTIKLKLWNDDELGFNRCKNYLDDDDPVMDAIKSTPLYSDYHVSAIQNPWTVEFISEVCSRII